MLTYGSICSSVKNERGVFMKFLISATISIIFAMTSSTTFAGEGGANLSITPEDLSQKLKSFKAFEEVTNDKNQSISASDVKMELLQTSHKSTDLARGLSISGIPTRLQSKRLSENSSGSFDMQGYADQPQPRWLLSLDGGGIRGLMQLQIIAEIERLTKKSIIELFDGISGTSVGGIIACVLTMPDPLNTGKPKYTAQDLLDIFCKRKKELFESKWQSCGGLFGTRYKTKSIRNLLKDILKDNKFSDRLLPTVLVSHNLITNEEQLLSTTDSEDFYAWNVALATASAPTYFKPQRIFPIDAHPSHRGYVLSDGGTCMNNPTMAGIALMHDVYQVDPDDLNVLSLGTGTSGTTQLNKSLLRGGILSWGVTIADTCIAGQASSTNKLAELYCKNRYHRLNPILDQRNLSLDDISESNQEVLFTASIQCIKENREEIDEVITSLIDSYKRKKHKKRIRFEMADRTSDQNFSSRESQLSKDRK